jgi:putative heme iron utilization protein
MRPISRSLGLSSAPGATLSAIATELDSTYRDVLDRLPENPAVRFAEKAIELILSPWMPLKKRHHLLHCGSG